LNGHKNARKDTKNWRGEFLRSLRAIWAIAVQRERAWQNLCGPSRLWVKIFAKNETLAKRALIRLDVRVIRRTCKEPYEIRAYLILLISGAFLLVSCGAHTEALQKQAPKWKGPLMAAIHIDDVWGVSHVLAENSLSPDAAMNENSVTPLMIASSAAGSESSSGCLIMERRWTPAPPTKIPLNTPKQPVHTALHGLCSWPLEIARHLIERGAKLNRQDSKGNTPLVLACALGHLDTAKF